MSEYITDLPDYERLVFGEAFTFKGGVSQDGDLVKSFFEERIAGVESGEVSWLPRTLRADGGICVDLFKDGVVQATLHFDYEGSSATVYATSEGGDFGDTILCDHVTFDEAVFAAEQFVGK